jgi:hypothetical protein
MPFGGHLAYFGVESSLRMGYTPCQIVDVPNSVSEQFGLGI